MLFNSKKLLTNEVCWKLEILTIVVFSLLQDQKFTFRLFSLHLEFTVN